MDADFNETGICTPNALVPNDFWHEIHERFVLCLNEEFKKNTCPKAISCKETVDADFNKIGISTLVAWVPKHFWSLLCLEGGIQEKYMSTSKNPV